MQIIEGKVCLGKIVPPVRAGMDVVATLRGNYSTGGLAVATAPPRETGWQLSLATSFVPFVATPGTPPIPAKIPAVLPFWQPLISSLATLPAISLATLQFSGESQ
jgi:hypothetical protein